MYILKHRELDIYKAKLGLTIDINKAKLYSKRPLSYILAYRNLRTHQMIYVDPFTQEQIRVNSIDFEIHTINLIDTGPTLITQAEFTKSSRRLGYNN